MKHKSQSILDELKQFRAFHCLPSNSRGLVLELAEHDFCISIIVGVLIQYWSVG